MRYADLYAYSESLTGPAVSVKDLATQICAHHGNDVGLVNFWPVELDSDISFGHLKYEWDRDSPYEDEFRIANIRFDKTLNRCWTRFVCCKELMHVFDNPEERADTRDEFFRLMSELESLRMKDDMSAMFLSELEAQWMAVIILCPPRLRNKYKPLLDNKTMTEYDIALTLKIPEAVIRNTMSDYYDQAMARLLNNGQ